MINSVRLKSSHLELHKMLVASWFAQFMINSARLKLTYLNFFHELN
jgi:hypothetical protein